MAIAFTIAAASVVLLFYFGRDPIMFVLLTGLVFLAWGEIFSLFPSTLGDYFGARHATSNYSVLYTAKGVSAVIIAGGPAALLFERFGSWSPVLALSVAMAAAAAAIAFALRAGQERRIYYAPTSPEAHSR
jgi:OFA family oxalate/formate antiporter-like MFS transporter